MDELVDNRYRVLEPLGGGGMATVYLAHDEVLGRDVAIKVLRGEYAHDPEFVERFRREAQSAAALSHPNIVPVYDRGETEDGTYYIAMEHVPGGTLKEYIRKNGSLDPARAGAVAEQVAEALSAAHGRGVIHRDIKPQNVLVTASGDVKVADFGIARAASATAISRTNFVVGTVNYMAPEQAMGETATPRSDLYSLGVVLYEMLTGELPFESDSQVGVAMKHINEPPRPPREANPEIPEPMNAVVMKLLEKRPEDRYADAAEFVEDLERVQNGFPPTIADAGAGVGAGTGAAEEETERRAAAAPPTPAWRSSRGRNPRRFLALVVLLPLLGVAGLGLWSLLGDPGVAGFLDGPAGSPRGGELGSVPRDVLEEARQIVGVGKGEVPGVEGMSVEEARRRLEDAGFEVGVRPRKSSGEDIGRVLEQSAPSGQKVELGSTILLAVGRGPDVAVPDLSGLTLSEARSTLGEADLTLGEGGVKESSSATAPAGTVVAQDPAAGTKTAPNTSVRLTVSSGPQRAAGDSQQAASQPSESAGSSGSGSGSPGSGSPGSGTEADAAPPSGGAAGTAGANDGSSPTPAAGTTSGTEPAAGPSATGTAPPATTPAAGAPTPPDGVSDDTADDADEGEDQIPTGTTSGTEPAAGPSADPSVPPNGAPPATTPATEAPTPPNGAPPATTPAAETPAPSNGAPPATTPATEAPAPPDGVSDDVDEGMSPVPADAAPEAGTTVDPGAAAGGAPPPVPTGDRTVVDDGDDDDTASSQY